MTDNERKQRIFKQLKYHLNYLKENHPNYNVIYIALQGSQNYNLDTYTDEYMSDVDTKAIVVPSLEDISLNKQPISTTIVLPNNEHIDVKDIRLMMDNFKKQNINFLEILFTSYRIINSSYKDLINKLISMKEDIAHYNTNQALRCMSGMSMEKKKALCHPYPSLLYKIEKYGYDGKQLHHIIRMNEFIKAYVSGKSFEECLVYHSNIEELMNAKLNKFSLEEALQLAEYYDEDTKLFKDKFLVEVEPVNKETLDKMNDIQYEIIKREIELELADKQQIQKPVNEFSKYNNIFVTSDIHFCHANIIKFEPNRHSLLDETEAQYVNKHVKFDSKGLNLDDQITLYMTQYYKDKANIMNEQIIQRYNSVVKNNDLVFILGDIALNYKDIQEVNSLIKRLNGDKVLILGNHDKFIIQDKGFDKSLFKEIVDYKEVNIYGKYFSMFHYPIASFNRQDKGGILLYGHIHSNELPYRIPHSYNVGMDVNNYIPINIKDIIKIDNMDTTIVQRHNNIEED